MVDAPRLFLITPPIADASAFAPLLAAAGAAGDVACVLIRAASRDERAIKAIVRTVAPIAQGFGAAALVQQEARFAARLDVDGVHVVAGGDAFQDTLDEALAALKPSKIVGAAGFTGRDAAMAAGEAGVDYLMFGTPSDDTAPDGPMDLTHEDVCDLVAWWAQIFNVPCVGYARHPDLAGDVAAAGAEFIGLCDGLWERPEAIATTLAAVSKAIAPLPEDVR